jgi:hypothetical protein
MYILAMWLCSQLVCPVVQPSAFADLYHRTTAMLPFSRAIPGTELADMRRALSLVTVWSIFYATVHSAENSTNSTNSTSGTDSDQPLCGSTLDQANGVGRHARVKQKLTIGMRD